jgi:hypothetical protein
MTVGVHRGGEMVQIANVIASGNYINDGNQNFFFNIINRLAFNQLPYNLKFKLTIGVIDIDPKMTYELNINIHGGSGEKELLKATIPVGPLKNDVNIIGTGSVFVSSTADVKFEQTGVYAIDAIIYNKEDVTEKSALSSYLLCDVEGNEING